MKQIVLHLRFGFSFIMLLLCAAAMNGQTSLTPVASAFSRGGAYAAVVQPRDTLRVRGAASSADNRRATYLRFDLSSAPADFNKAELQLTFTLVVAPGTSGAPTLGTNNRIDVFTVDDTTWDETALTWNNAPARNQYLFTQEILAKLKTQTDTTYTMDLGQYVKTAFAAGKRLFSFCLVDTTNNNTDIRFWGNTSIFGTPPTLVLSSGPVSTISLTTPVGAESWKVGETKNITWSSANVSNVKVEYTSNNGSTWSTLVASTPAAAGSYSWTIPDTIPSSANCKIKVSDITSASIQSISPSTFTVLNNSTASLTLTSPAGGEIFLVGSVQNIAWTGKYVTRLKVEYTSDGVTWNTVAPSVLTSGNFQQWAVPNEISKQCKVRLTDVVNPLITTTSPGVFTIAPANKNQIYVSDNSYVKAGNPDSCFYADTLLRVRGTLTSTTTTSASKTYVKFNLSTFTGVIDRAELKMTVKQVVSSSTNSNRIDLYTVEDDSWIGSTLTYNNAPMRISCILSQDFKTKLAADPDTVYSFDVTSFVKQQFAGDKVASFQLIDTLNSGTDIRFWSSRQPGNLGPVLALYTSTKVSDEYKLTPYEFKVSQNYPNPFNPDTKIVYNIPKTANVTIEVFDVLGQRIATLLNASQNAGVHEVVWNARSAKGSASPSGIYFCRVQSGNNSKVIKMILNR
jgi:hypothetical protein